MAEIRVERKRGGFNWLWLLIGLVVILAAVFLLDRAGYIDIPGLGASPSDTITLHAPTLIGALEG